MERIYNIYLDYTRKEERRVFPFFGCCEIFVDLWWRTGVGVRTGTEAQKTQAVNTAVQTGRALLSEGLLLLELSTQRLNYYLHILVKLDFSHLSIPQIGGKNESPAMGCWNGTARSALQRQSRGTCNFKILPPKQTVGRQGHGLSTVAIKVSFWGVSHAQGTTKQGAVHSKNNPDNDVIRKAPSGESSSPDLCGVGAGMWPR